MRSGVQDFGNLLIDGGSQWILDRFATRIVHQDPAVRIEGILLMVALLRQQTDHRKEFLVQNYDLVKTGLKLLKAERVARIAMSELDMITLSILRDSQTYNTEFDPDLNGVNFEHIFPSFLDEFHQNQGSAVYDEVRIRFQESPKIVHLVNTFIDHYFQADPGQLHGSVE